ncbi:MCE family protein [Mycobacterium sp. CVI_P3]|uniref:MCE family protein n=1 Tax=Mycobacterium pinniadriaticum TaxID=2994102 RepID=A0ABT3SGV9_9MYCO|nr:MCE family protein [Mycobacterium pinniadriaticum]MCX2932407.1 MCE family protein [Mycobacterium pinniadriaticum]MCX2938736.1 MCE family protein [Mycobacterium pinniadriaticum]
MNRLRNNRSALAVVLIVTLGAGLAVTLGPVRESARTRVTVYFANTNGLYPGDEVRILGVPVGKVDSIQPQPEHVKVEFSFDAKYRVPADADAVILSPSLVTARAIQLTPAYTSGPTMDDNAVIPQSRTAVPVEWDDFRVQLEKLAKELQPTEPGGVSPLGAFVDTTADNLRGQGANIRDAIIKLSQTFSALGDHHADIFGTVKNLSLLVSALQSSTDLMGQLNTNFAGITALLSNNPNEVATAVRDLNTTVDDVRSFLAENRDSIATTSEKVTAVTGALVESLDDIKQLLHIGPNGFQDFTNVYQPAQGSVTGIPVINNFADPISFICGAIQAASRLGAEQSAKLCVQYLAPIVKNRQYNFPPLGENLIVGPQARPNEITYSEDSLRPDHVPVSPSPPSGQTVPGENPPPLPAEAVATNPAEGLPGMMAPPTGGS